MEKYSFGRHRWQRHLWKGVLGYRNILYKNTSLINLQGNALGLMPDNVILSLVQSDYIGHSKLDLDTILILRDRKQPATGDQKIQPIDVGAADWTKIISLDTEGIIDTHWQCGLQLDSWSSVVKTMKNMIFPNWLPALSLEINVKMVTWVSDLVYGHEVRHRRCNATDLTISRDPQLIPSSNTFNAMEPYLDKLMQKKNNGNKN